MSNLENLVLYPFTEERKFSLSIIKKKMKNGCLPTHLFL